MSGNAGGIAGNGGGGDNAPTKTKELQCQHSEDTAEEEVDIEEDRIVEIVARQTGDYEGDEEGDTVFIGYDRWCGGHCWLQLELKTGTRKNTAMPVSMSINENIC
jgi:hypothetical protein